MGRCLRFPVSIANEALVDKGKRNQLFRSSVWWSQMSGIWLGEELPAGFKLIAIDDLEGALRPVVTSAPQRYPAAVH